MRALLPSSLVASALVGCATVSEPCPEIASVTSPTQPPDQVPEVWHLEDSELVVAGSGFQALPDGLGEDDGVHLPTAQLVGPDTIALDVLYVDDTELRVVVTVQDPLAAVGTYDLVVTNPGGCSDTLPGAVIVTDTPPRRLDDSIRLDAITPPFGWTESETGVTITGDGFVSTPRAFLSVSDGYLPEHEIGNLAFVSATSLAGIVPAGLPVGGPYDLWVENPDGGYNVLDDAFTVTADPPPDILDIAPAAGETQEDTDVVVTGDSFVEGATVELLDAEGNVTAATVVAATPTQLDIVVPSSTMSVGQYLVRLRNPDGSYDDHAAFVVRNPSAKLGGAGPWRETQALGVARRGHGLVSWLDDLGRGWLFAIGGESGSEVFDFAERAQVDAFGELGPWTAVPTVMTTVRSHAGWVAVDGWVYAIGGTTGGITLDTVERARVLVDEAGVAPRILTEEVAPGGSLEAGTWYYRVSAVLDGDDPYNPGGETLASPVEVVRVPEDDGQVTITWDGVDGAVSYRVYRTDAVDGAAGTEHLIAGDVDGQTFTDDGLPPGTVPYVPDGSLGVWQELPDRLPAPRAHGAPVLATTPEGDPIVYVVGGTADGSAPEAEVFAMIPPGPWFVAGSTVTPRMDLGAGRAGYDVAPSLGEGSVDFVVALQGDDGAGATNTVEGAAIGAGGMLAPFSFLRDDAGGQTRVDGQGLISADHVYFLGGGGDATQAESTGRQAQVAGPDLELDSWSSTSATGTMLIPRADFGLAPLRATLYAAGGRTDTAEATTSVEQVVY